MKMEEKIKVGRCSRCGGNVMVYKMWAGDPDYNRGTCEKCGRQASGIQEVRTLLMDDNLVVVNIPNPEEAER